jgi:phosphatidylglycerol:prolipoprotein diacylglycerol transferase
MIVDRYGVHFGVFTLHFYGLLIMTGVVASALLSQRQAKRLGQDPERIWDMLTWLLIAGVIGARLWHLLTPPASMVEQGITAYYYLTHPLDAIAIWRGGLGIFGAVIGGVLALFIYARRYRLNFFTWLDIIAPGLVLAQAIGRWGNFVNQELYGAPSKLPWAIYIEPAYRLPQLANIELYHPLFLYESLWNVATMFFLLWLGKRFSENLKPGDIFLSYLICYPGGRFFLEFLRLDASLVGGININQTIMAVLAVSSAGLLLWRHKSSRDGGEENQKSATG